MNESDLTHKFLGEVQVALSAIGKKGLYECLQGISQDAEPPEKISLSTVFKKLHLLLDDFPESHIIEKINNFRKGDCNINSETYDKLCVIVCDNLEIDEGKIFSPIYSKRHQMARAILVHVMKNTLLISVKNICGHVGTKETNVYKLFPVVTRLNGSVPEENHYIELLKIIKTQAKELLKDGRK